MPKAPKGYLSEPIDHYCQCDTEGGRLICYAEKTRMLFGPTTKDLIGRFPYTSLVIGKPLFEAWIGQLGLDLFYADPVIGFRAIMENWTRARILRVLRDKGCTKL